MHCTACAILLAAVVASSRGDAPPPANDAATVVVANRAIVTFRASVHGADPEERARLASARIDSLPRQAAEDPVSTQPMTLGSESGLAVLVGGRLALFVVEGDAEPLSGEALEPLARSAADRLSEALRAERDQRSLRLVLRSVAESGAATAVLLVVLWVAARLRRQLTGALRSAAERRTAGLTRRGIDLTPLLSAAVRGVSFVAFWSLAAALADLWLMFVLGRFPVTAPWADVLSGRAVGILRAFGLAVLASIPRLATIVLIMLAARAIVGFLGGVFARVEGGTLRIRGLYPETLPATRRIAMALVWLVALAASYPYIPGAGSDAVKGLSLLVGVMLSLGSTGLVSQAMSGLAVVYSRALATGDTVRLGDTEGVVTAVGLLSTKIVTLRGEEVTVPNTVVIGGAVRNFTRLSAGNGPLVTTAVTIGYDAPWRQVEQLLLGAALETRGIRAQPAPFVLQRSLSDFFVAYELVARLAADPVDRPQVLSELHAHIQDAFNAAGVQIMSPHFVVQPDRPVVVPRGRWEGEASAPERRRG
jgi:small-conductance mechanosensitive channel